MRYYFSKNFIILSVLLLFCFISVFFYTNSLEYIFSSNLSCFLTNFLGALIPLILYCILKKTERNGENLSRKKFLSVFVLASFFSLFCIYSLNIYKHNPQIPAEFEITATGEKYSESLGSDVDIVNIKADNIQIPFNFLEKTGSVKQEMYSDFEQKLILKLKKNSSVKFKTKASKIYIVFAGDSSKGVAKIRINNKTYFEDTFTPEYGNDIILVHSAKLLTFPVNINPSFKTQILKYLHTMAYFVIFFLTFYYLSLIVLNFNIEFKDTNYKIPLIHGILYALPILISSSIALIIFFPGIAQFDAQIQWFYVHHLPLDNSQPLFHTYLMYLLTRLYDSPATICIFQILIFSFFVGYFFSILEKHNISQKLLMICSLVISIIPYNFCMSVNLHRDVIYGYFIFAITLCLFLICVNQEKFFMRNLNITIFVVSMIFCFFIRFNGILVVFLLLALIPILFKNKIKLTSYIKTYILFFIVLGFCLYIGVNTKVEDNSIFVKNQILELPIHQIQAVYRYNGNVKFENELELQKIFPIFKFKKFYTKYWLHGFILLTPETKWASVDKKRLLRVYIPILKDNFWIMFKDWLDINSFIFKYAPNPEGYDRISNDMLMGMFIYMEKKYAEAGMSMDSLRQKNIIPNLNNHIVSLFDKYSSIILKPTIPFILFIFFGMIFLVKNGYKFIITLLPSLLSLLSITISLPMMCPRFLFYFYILFPLIILLAFCRIEENKF